MGTYTYDFIMDAIDAVIQEFMEGTPDNGFVHTTRLSPLSTDDDEIRLYLPDEIQYLLDAFNIENKVELIEASCNPGITIYTLCISFYTDHQLGTYNILCYDM